jgi:threonine/homoserine/homoserine lactone efflux protein
LISFLGVIPPGMLNMSAARISLKEGHNRSFMFSIGVCIVVGLQTYVATIFAKYLNQHPDVTSILKRVAIVIFLLIAFYFFITANRQTSPVKLDRRIKSKQSRFFQGVFISALNIFPIPFQAYVVTSLLSAGWLNLDPINIGAYIAGAAMGTFIALYIYILFFDTIKNNKITSAKNMNYSIALITFAVAIVTFVNLI